MSVGSAFYTGLSGLDSSGMAMGVMGDNMANMGTTGYKGSSIFFGDVLGLSLTGVSGGNRVGAGSKTQAVDVNYTQGTFETTGSGTDVAVNGNGFFVVRNPGDGSEYYTRDGHLGIDNEGYYINSQGYRVQGYKYGLNSVTGEYALEETLTDLKVTPGSINPPVVTTTATMKLNLDASADINTTAWAIPPTPDMYNYSAPVTIYDSLGSSHVIQVYFSKSAASTWDWHALIDGGDVTGGIAGTPQLFGSGAGMAFDPATGEMTAPATAVPFHAGGITFINGSPSVASTIDFADSVSFASPSMLQDLNQNGFPPGSATSVSIDEFGNLTAAYSNGTNKPLFRMALATFKSLGGLERKGLTLYQNTIASGDPLYGKAGEGSLGKINPTMLEQSNVDLATEMIKMIIVQRAYQANAKVITMADEMMQAVQNIR
ncbi:MAG: flagellar hook protein FlgE [Desulfobacteraceae bacterium]|nr:MAG: flagellar hook protein FlgE [Desulfobacteraceae bacterium]